MKFVYFPIPDPFLDALFYNASFKPGIKNLSRVGQFDEA